MKARHAASRLAIALAAAAALSAAVLAPGAAATPEPSPSPTPPHVVVPHVTLRVPAGLWAGEDATLKVSVDPALPGEAVAVEALRGDEWTTEATATLDARSQARVTWRPEKYGPLRLRASIGESEGHAGAVTAWYGAIVNRPNAHDVPYRFAHYIVTVVHEYRLYYYEHGKMVRAFDVALGRPGFRTPLGTFRIYGKRKPAGGALGSCAMFYRRQGGIAIHGTNEPQLLKRFPRPFSHGCARMYNGEALWLYARVPTGTPVHNVR